MKYISIIKNISKALLLWFTAFVIIVYICSAAEVINTGNFLILGIMFAEVLILLFLCKIVLNKEDIYKLSGYNLFIKLIGGDKDEEDD